MIDNARVLDNCLYAWRAPQGRSRIKAMFTPPTLLAVLIACSIGNAWASDYFDPSMLTLLGGSSSAVDLSQFESKGAIPEGEYLVDVFLNQNNVATQKITFKKNTAGKVVPVLTPTMLERYGVDISRLALAKGSANTPIDDLSKLIPSASSVLSLSQLRLDLSIPQMYVTKQVGGYVDPALWDQGVPALRLNYNLNGSKTWQDGSGNLSGGQSQNIFATFTGGLNAGPWRLRSGYTVTDSQSRWQQSSMSMRSGQFSNTYLQRNVASLRSELSLGEISSGGDVFDGIPFRGVKLESDDAMTPSSQRGFSPVITGVAQSNALVTVTQNGNTIYQTNVAPGPFRIDDLYQAGTAGDLVITVKEADGSKHVSTQAYSTLPVMQRPGNYKYSLSTGRYRNGGYTTGSQNPIFAMGTLVYGLPHYVTLYGGVLGANNYQSVALGTGVSLGYFGALSFDSTMAKATLADGEGARGASYRMKYSKSMLSTGSTVDLTSYRYSTSRYFSFSDVNGMGYSLRDDVGPWSNGRKRSSWQVSLSQSLRSYGSIYLRGTRDDYWGRGGVQNTLSAGYNSNFHGINYNLNYSVDRRVGQGNWPVNRQLAFNMSVPLSLFSAAQSAQGVYLNYNLNHSNQGGSTTQQVSGGGSINNALSYSASQGWGNHGNGTSGSFGMNYNGDNMNSSAGYNYGRRSRGINASLSGGMLVHQHGIIMSKNLGDTLALVSVPGVEGVRVGPGGGATNGGGYALVPYMSMYQKNIISLDPTTLPNNAEVLQNSVNLYPTRGAVVLAKFKPRIGHQVLMTLLFKGKPVPFGAMASLVGEADNSSIVGDGGEVYLSGLPEKGGLRVQWGRDVDQQCQATFTLPPAANVPKNKLGSPAPSTADFIKQLQAVCQ